ncbi:histidine phosphatase family protein [Pseudomonas petrae]|uniref:Histidine phosphatase family protein n=1 Tax=Pseudomonas petrae TaxID=2912190 RepID=A0ABS9I5Y4_9PSED|nr:histidine phosphatase family protein [Pseudomonas petrae]MCF7532985.1 histidine phosphatase family protein [Pseudomonas petrae]MCF7535659.1 histidine phosphatase family protein [Pseudomonas petrae]MCF7543185.1 histidine phosphatase family protein [Pseudomonas petrae]
MHQHINLPPEPTAGKLLKSANKFRVLLTAAAIVVSLLLLTGYTYWPRSPVQLAAGENMRKAGLYESWKKGEVVVLVRHGERCDRSDNECLGPKDGITRNGSQVSAQVGHSLSQLGLAQTDVLASPSTRTEQTAESLFGHPVASQDWLFDCQKMNLSQVMAHKASHRNLVLVTHSGCISQIESKQGYPHADTSEYDSAVFISLDKRSRPVIRGVLNPQDWKQLAMKAGD